MRKANFPEELKMSDGTALHYRALLKFKCIYCGKWATIIEFSDGGAGVIHETPECASFTIIDPVIYTRKNREKFQQEVAEGKFEPN